MLHEPAYVRERMRRRGVCVIIPTYNNCDTLGAVIDDVRQYCGDVIVVNDGSTDATQDVLLRAEGVRTITYAHNHGKGYALRCGFRWAKELGFAYAITMDADGQHLAKELPSLLEANIQSPGALVVGSRRLSDVCRSSGSKFANSFSNFWFSVQTFRHLPDTQSGFRLYPLRKRMGQRLLPPRYEAETLMLVLAAWHGVSLVSTPVDVYYPPKPEERVSHFRPLSDFGRISVLNTLLCPLAVCYAFPLWCVRTLLWLVRNVYSLLFFLFFSLVVLTPLAWVVVEVGRMTERKRLWLHRLIRYASRVVMLRHGIPGVRFSYRVREGVDFDVPHVVICNHQSHLDLVCLLIFTPKIVFLTNDWVWSNPFYGFIIRNAEYLPVRKGIEELLPRLKDLAGRGYSIAVFPEGTRSIHGRIGRFHSGAFHIAAHLGLDVLPMVLYGTGRVLTKKEHRLHKGCISVEATHPISQAELVTMGSEREQAREMRRRYESLYEALKDETDRNA